MQKEFTVDEWFEEIEHGLEYRKVYGLEHAWYDLEQLFYNTHCTNGTDGPNIIQSTGDALMASLHTPKPGILISPRKRDNILTARVLESVDNDLIVDMKMKKSIARSSLHSYLFGKGILKIGYDSEYGWDDELDFGVKEPIGMSLSQFDKKGNRIEFNSSIRPGMPWVQSCMPHDIIVPWGTLDIDDAEWIAHRVIRHIDHVNSDVKYSNKGRLQPVMSRADFVDSYKTVLKPYRAGVMQTGNNFRTRKAEYVELFEIHDKRTENIYVVATGHKKFLRKDKNTLQMNGLPFVDFNFIPTTRTFWNTPDSYYIMNHQNELNDIALQTTKHRRLSILKFLTLEGAMEESELENLLSPDVGVTAKVKANFPLKESIQPFNTPNTNPQLYNDAEHTRRNAREAVGFSRNQIGEFEQSGRRTATEARTVQEGSSLRMNRRHGVIGDAYARVFEKINPILFEHWRALRWVQAAGPDGQQIWLQINGEDLRGDFNYSYEFTNEPVFSQALRGQQAMQQYAAFAQDPNINQQQLQQNVQSGVNKPEFDNLFLNTQGSQNANLQLPVQQQQVQQ